MLVLLLTISLLIILGLGFYVLVTAPHRQINRVFAVFNGMMTLWVLKDLLFWGFPDGQISTVWWVKVSFLIAVLLPFTFQLFVQVFPENFSPNWRRLAIQTLPLLILIPMLEQEWPWRAVSFVNGLFRIELTGWAGLYGAYIYLILGDGVWQMWRKRRQHRETIWSKQIDMIMLAVVLTGLLLLAGGNLLPLRGDYRLLPYSSLFIVIGALVYTYAITNFNLFSLPTALDQLRLFPLTYKLTIVVTGIGFIGFFAVQLPLAIWALGTPGSDWIKYIVLSTIAVTAPSLVLVLLIVRLLSRPLRELTELALDVSRGNYGAQSKLVSNDELGVLASSFNIMSRKMAEDIAQLKEINQVMLRSERLATAGALATSVAHEVNNPLASISSLVQSLLIREPEEKNRETLRTILGQITRISMVLRDLMDFARPKMPEPRPTDLNQVIRKTLELAFYDKRFKRLRIETGLDPALPPLLLDQDRLQQVLLNLLLNAREAIEEERQDGQIAIRTRLETEASRRVYLEISDNGTGIPGENLSRIFDPFFTTKHKSQGTGLGLPVCLNIVTALGGTITAHSATGGTTFTITFPIPESTVRP
jgi:signal transduction histidine kinase